MFRTIRRVINTLKKVFTYLPVFWNESDYHYSSIYALLHTKFSRMDKVWEDYHQHFSYQGQEEDRQLIIKLMDLSGRLHRDDYLSEALVDHYEKWGNYIDLDKFISDKPDEDGFYRWIGDTNEERHSEFMECSLKASATREREKHELFNLMSDNIDKLWI